MDKYTACGFSCNQSRGELRIYTLILGTEAKTHLCAALKLGGDIIKRDEPFAQEK